MRLQIGSFRSCSELPGLAGGLPIARSIPLGVLLLIVQPAGADEALAFSFEADPTAEIPSVPAEDEVEEPSPFPVEAPLDKDARLYRTNAERRDVGLQRNITPWLIVSGLLEIEGLRDEFSVKWRKDKEIDRVVAAAVQLGLVASPWKHLKGELVVEYDTESDQLFTEEVIASLDLEPWELEGGIQYLPFGVYISHFPSGPLLEFGETRAKAANLSYGRDERLDLALALYQGRTREVEADAPGANWALAMEAWPLESLAFGLSYQSNLADSDARLLAEEDNRYLRKVPGLSGYLIWISHQFEVTFEALGALHPFRVLPPDFDQPRAWNLEFAHFPWPSFEWALRIEGSQELEDAPELRYGAAVTWRFQRRASFSLEYLHGRFKEGFATNEEDKSYEYVDQFGAQLSIAF